MSTLSVRLPDSIHRNARLYAEREGTSLNGGDSIDAPDSPARAIADFALFSWGTKKMVIGCRYRQHAEAPSKMASGDAKVRLDLNNPVFQANLLTLQKPERHAALDRLKVSCSVRFYDQPSASAGFQRGAV